MKRYFAFVCLSAALLALSPLATSAAAKPISLQDYRALLRIESPRFSPDGKQIAFLTVQQDFAHDRNDATLRMMNTAGGKSRILVQGMLDLNSPRWSPDGHALAFIATAGKQKAQIYT
ncbi:MAG: hypothetical protein ACRESC_03430, partial [Gammaproteobacteria bacterium]